MGVNLFVWVYKILYEGVSILTLFVWGGLNCHHFGNRGEQNFGRICMKGSKPKNKRGMGGVLKMQIFVWGAIKNNVIFW